MSIPNLKFGEKVKMHPDKYSSFEFGWDFGNGNIWNGSVGEPITLLTGAVGRSFLPA